MSPYLFPRLHFFRLLLTLFSNILWFDLITVAKDANGFERKCWFRIILNPFRVFLLLEKRFGFAFDVKILYFRFILKHIINIAVSKTNRSEF